MSPSLIAAVVIAVAIGVTHSYLGERYILMRLMRRDNLPKLFGDDRFTKRTLRWAWHATTLAWWGLGLVMLAVATGEPGGSGVRVLRAVSLTFAASTVLALVASRGKHLSWIAFLAISVITWWASG